MRTFVSIVACVAAGMLVSTAAAAEPNCNTPNQGPMQCMVCLVTEVLPLCQTVPQYQREACHQGAMLYLRKCMGLQNQQLWFVWNYAMIHELAHGKITFGEYQRYVRIAE